MEQPIRILKRQPNSEPCLSDLPNDISKKKETKNRPIKTLEEREAAYAEARKRILGSSDDSSSQDISKDMESNEDTKKSMEDFIRLPQHPLTMLPANQPLMETHTIHPATAINHPLSLKSQIACCHQFSPYIMHCMPYNSNIINLPKDFSATAYSNINNNFSETIKQSNIAKMQQLNNLNYIVTSKPINNIVLELNTPASDYSRKPKNNMVNNSFMKLANTDLCCDTKERQPVEATNNGHITLVECTEGTIANSKQPEMCTLFTNYEQQKYISFEPNQIESKIYTDTEYQLQNHTLKNIPNNASNNVIEKIGLINLKADNTCKQLSDI